MSTAQTMIYKCKEHLLGNTREEQNYLNGAYTAGGTSITLSDQMGTIAAGAELEIGTEIFRVRSVSGQSAVVAGAQMGTTASNHADGSLVIVNPRFRSASIFNDLNNALNDISAAGIYKETAVDITYNPVVSAYDITGSSDETLMDILEVRYRQVGPTKRFPVIRNWSLMRDMDTAVFPSGNALVIDSPGFPGLPIRVRYAQRLAQFVNLTDDSQTVCGLRPTADDLPPIGAAIRQLMGRDIKRTFLEAQPDTRRAQEVPPGVAQGAITTLRRMFEQGIAEEHGRQVQRYPYRNFR